MFPVTCKIEGCEGRATAHGLCAKHYMRLRRTGDAATQPRKRGPKPSDWSVIVNDMFREWSPRKRATYTRAMMMPFLRGAPMTLNNTLRDFATVQLAPPGLIIHDLGVAGAGPTRGTLSRSHADRTPSKPKKRTTDEGKGRSRGEEGPF
jgi:hypothetical protein